MSFTIQSHQVIQGLHNAVTFLQDKQDVLNHMNVFPVADQDTGSNMLHSMKEACRNLPEDVCPALLFHAAYQNLLQYSHGNSGTILTLFFEGFSGALSMGETLSGKELALAFSSGAKRAFQGVSNPMDGTILSVSRQSGDAALSLSEYTDDAGAIWERITLEAFSALPFTAQRNPVLKEHQVMDSGAYGFCIILDAFLTAFYPEAAAREYPKETLPVSSAASSPLIYRFCTELVLEKISSESASLLKERLAPLGDSFLLVHKDTLAKIHIHTNSPEEVLAIAEKFGTLLSQKVDDMAGQLLVASEDFAPIPLIVCCEETSLPLFESLGALVLATKNGPCENAPSLDTLLQKPFFILSSVSEEDLQSLLPGLPSGTSVTYRDDDLSLAELLL